MKRKILTGLGFTLAMILLSSKVFADINTSGSKATDTGTTTVTYTVPSSYTVVIPGTLAITAANTPVGDEKNVFIKTSSQVADNETVTVSLAPQTFTANNADTSSSIPFTVSYKVKNGTTALPANATDAPATISSGTALPILVQTGLQIAVVGDIDESTATTGTDALSATVTARTTTAQIAAASKSGIHTGTIQFSVSKTS